MNFSASLPFLVDQMVQQGVPEHEAKAAADRCVKAIALSGVSGYFVGQLAGPALWALFVNPAAAGALVGVGGVAAVAAMAYQVGLGNSCSDVRHAVMNWNTGTWGENSF